MPLKLNSSGGGSVTLDVPSTASDFTATMPANTGTVVTDGATQTLTNKTLSSPTISGTPVMSASVLTLATAQNSTSGTSIDFTGIPSWVRRITIMFSGVSTNGASNYLIQIGDSGGIETTGYLGSSAVSTDTATITAANYTTGFGLLNANAGNLNHGIATIALLGSNIWTFCAMLSRSNSASIMYSAGSKTLSDTLDRVRITTVNGTNAFDAGSINIMYE